MGRRWFQAGALAAALLASAGCARQDTAVVLMVVTVSGTLPDAVALNVTVMNPAISGTPPQSYAPGAGQPVVFPATLTAEIPGRATGTLTFEVTAQRADESVAASGQRTATVPAGASPTLYVQLTCAGKADGVCVPATSGPPDAGTNVQPNCGNGSIDPGETCDTAIAAGHAGACPPADCDDGVACTKDDGAGSGCTRTCTHSPITALHPQDGCCPADPDCSLTCGNGVVDPGETCDTAIPAATPGACPTSQACKAEGPCVVAQLVSAETCSAICLRTAITATVAGDGCCPAGASSALDPDCLSACGDGVRETGETCDVGIPPPQPGSCPVSCDDGNPCTTDALSGSGCQALCIHDQVTTPISGDGCCLPGSTRATDTDCPPICGDGVVEPGETCDPQSTGNGACPTSCPPSPAACLQTALAGSGADCSATCVSTEISACGPSDGCCPAACTAARDPDCSPTCGDGAVQAGEACDVAIAAGLRGACPRACDDGDPCTDDRLLSAGTCQATCLHLPVTAPIAGDGCCPPGGTFLIDADCAPTCGDGVVESPVEACDAAVDGSCPTDCPSVGSCATVKLRGDAATCSAACVATAITSCMSGDRCCPPGCTAATDSDCPRTVCGDGVVEIGEACDRGITAGLPGACPASCNDGDACTVDVAAGSVAACTRTCTHGAITACFSGDGCCPPGCTAATDADCAPTCNDGRIQAGETCDPPSTCPTACPDDGDPCTIDRLVGDPRLCTAACEHVPITTCSGGRPDGCCPSVCSRTSDTDC
jgi:hypothetical protein